MTPEALVLCTLARHGLLGTDLPDMLDLWPEVAVVKVVCDPKPATARKHPGRLAQDVLDFTGGAS